MTHIREIGAHRITGEKADNKAERAYTDRERNLLTHSMPRTALALEHSIFLLWLFWEPGERAWETYNPSVQPSSNRLCQIRRLQTETPQSVDEVGSLDKDEAHAAPTDIT